MPYVTKERRTALIAEENIAKTAGELNYLFTCIINDYIVQKNESYQTYNDIIGALEGAKIELYRRKIAGYEDKKILENGDVY